MLISFQTSLSPDSMSSHVLEIISHTGSGRSISVAQDESVKCY